MIFARGEWFKWKPQWMKQNEHWTRHWNEEREGMRMAKCKYLRWLFHCFDATIRCARFFFFFYIVYRNFCQTCARPAQISIQNFHNSLWKHVTIVCLFVKQLCFLIEWKWNWPCAQIDLCAYVYFAADVLCNENLLKSSRVVCLLVPFASGFGRPKSKRWRECRFAHHLHNRHIFN